MCQKLPSQHTREAHGRVGWVIFGTVVAQLLCAVGIADQTLFLLQT